MKRPIVSHLPLVALALGAVAVAGAAVWLLRRSSPAPELAEPRATTVPTLSEEWEELAPSSLSFGAELDSDDRVNARPVGRNAGFQTPDDYDAFSPEELGAAFLAGATDTALEEAPGSTSEISGFQI